MNGPEWAIVRIDAAKAELQEELQEMSQKYDPGLSCSHTVNTQSVFPNETAAGGSQSTYLVGWDGACDR
eukprot:gene25821-biopygen9075